MSTDALAAFLRARLDEREAGAREVLAHNARSRVRGLTSTAWDEQDADAQQQLREMAAMRALLTAYVKAAADWPGSEAWIAWRFTAEALASIWADHPDYDPEWDL